jgi:anion-transporting  ArsA/GET3 family ATPase
VVIAFDVRGLTANARILLCCGSGGVGKTTTAAALGYLAASQARKALVMTIDPARRLAQALGLDALTHEPVQVATDGPGELWAMMLDTKRTFDSLIEKYAPDAAVRDTIFANSYYQHLSGSLAGSREFMALEKVHEFVQSDQFDVLIVDTPPAQHALDFLDAPTRLFELFEGSLVSALLQPYRVAGRIGFGFFRRSSDAFLKILERLTGFQVLADLSDFFLAFSGMFDGFKARSREVAEMLRSADTRFVLVAAPDPSSLAAADAFFRRLTTDSLPVGGLIVNRVHEAPGALDGRSFQLDDADLAALRTIRDERIGGESLASRLVAAYGDHVSLSVLDHSAIEQTEMVRDAIAVRRVRHFNRDLHSLADIAAFAAELANEQG